MSTNEFIYSLSNLQHQTTKYIIEVKYYIGFYWVVLRASTNNGPFFHLMMEDKICYAIKYLYVAYILK